MSPILANLVSAAAHRRAEHALAEGRFAEAAEGFASLLARKEEPVFRMKRGLALWASGSRKQGREEAASAGAALPASHPARLFLALILIEEDRDAEEILKAVAAADPGNLFARGLRALSLVRGGRETEAAGLLDGGVFGSAIFRARLLMAVETRLRKKLDEAGWREAFLETVL